MRPGSDTPSTVAAVEQAEVVVRQPPDSGGEVRTGMLLARQGSLLTVRWDDDGQEEDVLISTTTTFAVRGGLRHQGLMDPAALSARLEADPVGVIVGLLREHGSALTAINLKEKLVDLRLAKEVVDKAWKRAQVKLSKLDEVRVANSANSTNKTYRWTEPKPDTTDTRAEPPTELSAAAADESTVAECLDAHEAPYEAPVVAAEEAASVSDTPGLASEHADSAGKTAAGSAPDTAVPMAQAVAAVLEDEPAPAARHYATRPLATAVRLGRLDDGGIDRLLESVGEEEQAQALALLAALPRSAKPIDIAERMTAVASTSIQAILGASAAELRERPPAGPEVMSAVGWLLRRVVVLPLDAQAIPPLIELAAAIAVDPGTGELEILDRVAHIIYQQLRNMTRDECKAVDPDVMARIMSKLPFAPQGGRAALLSAVGRVWPERVADEMWWREATLTDLADCATGLLGRVTVRPEVAERVITPLMVRELSKVTSRVRLVGLLAMPHEFVEHLPAEVVANALRRVAGDDQVVDSWVRALAAESRVAQLQADMERAQAETCRANERAEGAEAASSELATRYERLEKLLQQQHERSVGMRASQERQLRIDVIRALADLAAEVEELTASGTAPEVLVERVRALLSSWDLEAVGEVGASSTFDPESHEPIIGAPEVGAVVTVLRPGYRWRSGGEDVLLSRALVSLPHP
jgi:hypothetical protein